MSAGQSLEIENGIAILRMQAGKGNAIDSAFLDILARFLAELAQSGARAAVLTGYDRFFSGGLALPQLIGLERPAMRDFIERFSAVMLQAFRCPLPLVAAVNGHAIAGGCVLALQADWRIMADGELKIGLNEAQLGIGLPASVVEPLRLQLGPSAMVRLALEGQLVGPMQALSFGLVHEVVAPDAVVARAIARAGELGAVPGPAFAQIKAALRRPAVEEIVRVGQSETERWLDSWFSEPARTRLGEAVRRLTKA